MRIVKLDAIDSTNDFLKDLAARTAVENYTVVTAENQTKGKGQMGAIWNSEVGKNLIMSVLVKDAIAGSSQIYDLNIAVALSVLSALLNHDIPKLSIKWPNDIMSGDKKIGGILIENSFRSDGSITSVVGLGLNVNQTNFEKLPKASSLALVSDKIFNKEDLLVEIVDEIEMNVGKIATNANQIRKEYTSKLFKIGIPMPFENQAGQRFMGIINGVTPEGKIEILSENDAVLTFGIKEIQMLY